MEKYLIGLEEMSLSNYDLNFVQELCSYYTNTLNEIDRIEFRSKIYSKNLNLKLLSLSEIIAEDLIFGGDHDDLSLSLYLHSIEDFRWDYRENYIYLSIINYAYELLKQDLNRDVNIVKSYSSLEANHHFLEFFNRSKSLKSLKSMGLEVVKTSNKRIEFRPIKPSWEK